MSDLKQEGRYGLLIDYEFCTGCHSCEVACMKELNLPLNQYGIKLLEDGPRKQHDGKWEWNYVPKPTSLCNLCEDRVAADKLPTCVQHCQAQIMYYGPVSALAKRLENKPKQVLYVPK